VLHVTYFSSYALWSYLTIPFLYAYPGSVSEEIAPWEENGEQWRPLKVTFPDSIAGHTRNQISYFGPDGLLRRHEYTVDVLGNAPGLNYAFDNRTSSGIVVHISVQYLPTTAKSAKWRSLCSSRSTPMRSNSAKRHYDYSTRNGKGNIDDPDL